MPVKVIKQKVILPGTPKDAFELLMDEKKHAALIGDTVSINPKVGGTFATFSGYATGEFMEIIPNKKIVQEWHAQDWPSEAISLATFTFKARGKGCELHFTQLGVPPRFTSEIARGWIDYYWKPMKRILAEKAK